ncbi:MAG: DedA family protein [Syntrophorhabdus sp.]|jgi:membrane protein DedA with SNARE-associated domain|nr:DedA family protein [Syntrophorhabdus sp.]MDI9558165.1 DedA family protein [Pseudomonadota bacterium]OPX92759.1 MAG: Inner membrane protein YohD [Syntrophorhabdus sp. PtaB.Bin027]OQB77845.1 MAG: Inner membrane protein YohD [Deltaproteobacteria bacterium ADurb.Bin135]HQP52092.1 DedA family protein [Syntrophorhabdaceae bacterium]
MEEYIARYGYIAIVIGTFFEGETTVLLGGIFSKLHYMKLDYVMVWAFLGTFAGDCTFFLLGRVFGRNIIDRHDFLRSKLPLANGIMRRYGYFIIFLVRFFVGVRGVILLLLGCTDIKKRIFFLYSASSSALWSIVASAIGYLFANIVYIFVHDIKKYEMFLVPAVTVIVVMLIFVYRHIVKEKEKTYGNQ